MNKYKILIIVITFIIISLSIGSQVLVNPIIGLANNGDFQRFSQKIGIDYKENPWAEDKKEKYFWNYIIEDFKFVDPKETGFYSTQEFIGKIAIFFNNLFPNDGDFNLKWIGLVNTCFYLLGIGFLLFNLRSEHIGTILFFCTASILFFTDKEIIQYFNSFYTEPGSIIYLLFFFNLVLIWPKVIKNSKKYKIVIFLIAESLVIFLFLNAKLQNILGIVPMAALFIIQVFSFLKNLVTNQKIAISLSFLLLILTIILPNSIAFIKNTRGSNRIVSYNIIMMEFLDLSKKPKEHLFAMGFDEYEVDLLSKEIGLNAYSAPDSFEKYSEFFDRKAQLDILIREPSIGYKLLLKESKYLFKPLSYGNFLEIEGREPKSVSTEFTYVRVIKENLYVSNFFFFMTVLFTAVALSFSRIIKNENKDKKWLNIIFLSLPIFTMLFFLTTVFGDSGHEIIKHFFLVNILFDATFILVIYSILNTIVEILEVKIKV